MTSKAIDGVSALASAKAKMISAAAALHAVTRSCAKCGGMKFSKKPAANSIAPPMPAGALRCEGCQTVWHAEDLTGARRDFLAKEAGQAERV
jgi:hypothetical protein